MTPVVKDAFLKYQKNGRSLVVGLSPTPTWSFMENVWGYRSVEKTIIDLDKMGSSRDLVVLFETRLDSEGRASEQFMFGNGNGVKSEGDKDKKAYARIHFKATENAGLTIYADYESRPGDQDGVTLATLRFLLI